MRSILLLPLFLAATALAGGAIPAQRTGNAAIGVVVPTMTVAQTMAERDTVMSGQPGRKF